MLKILKTAKKKKKAMSGLMWALESKNNKIDSAENWISVEGNVWEIIPEIREKGQRWQCGDKDL